MNYSAEMDYDAIALAAVGKSSPPYRRMTAINPTTYFGKPIPPRRWIVDQWLGLPAVTINYADGGVGKTQLAQQLITACATGTPWIGLRVEPCRSFALFCEDSEDELQRRQDLINASAGICFQDLEAMRWVSGVGEDNDLIRFQQDGRAVTTERFDDLVAQAKEHRARLLVIDTAADTFGGNENERAQVRKFVGNILAGVAREIDGAVLLNAHPSRSGLKTGNIDGASTAWNNSARSRWSIERPKSDDGKDDLRSDIRILTRRKANYATSGDGLRLRFVHGVLVPDGISGSPHSAAIKSAETQDLFLQLLDRAEAEGRPVSHSKNATNFAPKRFARVSDGTGPSQQDFDRAMEALFQASKIKVRDYGKPSDTTKKIVRVERTDDGSTMNGDDMPRHATFSR